MRKKLLGLGIAVVVLVGLFFSARWILDFDLIQDEVLPGEVGLTYDRNRIRIYSFAKEKVETLTVTNAHGTYSVRENDAGEVEIVGCEGAPLLYYSSTGLFESIETISCDDLIEADCENLEHYGLDDPQAELTILAVDGSTTTFAIGDKSLLGEGYYMRDTSNRDVYIANYFFGDRYIAPFEALYDKKIHQYFENQYFQDFTLKRGEETVFIRATTEDEAKDIRYAGGMIMESPFFVAADADKLYTQLSNLALVEADAIVCPMMTEEDYVTYGFTDPVTVSIHVFYDPNPETINGEVNTYYDPNGPIGTLVEGTFTWEIGNIVDGVAYVRYQNAPVVYAVDATTFAFIDWALDDYAQRIVNIKYLNDLDAITVDYEGKTYHFDIKDPERQEEMVVTHEHVRLDQALFRDFYMSIISITNYGIAKNEPDTEPILTVRYSSIYGEEDDILLEFIPYDSLTCLLRENGRSVFLVLNSRVDKIVRDMHKLLNGEEIIN